MNRWKIASLVLLIVLVLTATMGCQPKPQNDLERILQAKKIVVGTSADYPPFEFMNESNEFDGFDVKLMSEVAKRMGVEVEWTDIAFDGLIGSLQTGKIDAVIAAMSATAERDEQVDFSINYYIGKDAVLVAEGSGLEIAAKEDLAGKKIGVQSGTIQDDWISENLPDDEISRYERAEQAVLDLKSGRIDVVAMDFFAASAYLKQGGIVLALETNFADEHMAIAVPEGSAELKAELDKIITDMQNDGFIEDLIMEYLVEE